MGINVLYGDFGVNNTVVHLKVTRTIRKCQTRKETLNMYDDRCLTQTYYDDH